MSNSVNPEFWRKCTSCKSPIPFGQKYWVCSVSTCNRQRTGLVFCKVSCFDAHVPVMNHRDAGAIEKRAPTLAEWQRQQDEVTAEPQSAPVGAAAAPIKQGAHKREILVVVSKTKDYVRVTAGFNTSDSVMEALSDRIRAILDEAIRRATQDGRKTVMDRDLPH